MDIPCTQVSCVDSRFVDPNDKNVNFDHHVNEAFIFFRQTDFIEPTGLVMRRIPTLWCWRRRTVRFADEGSFRSIRACGPARTKIALKVEGRAGFVELEDDREFRFAPDLSWGREWEIDALDFKTSHENAPKNWRSSIKEIIVATSSVAIAKLTVK